MRLARASHRVTSMRVIWQKASELYRASQAPSQILGLLHVICEDLPCIQALSNTSNIKHATQVKRPQAEIALSRSP